MITSIILGLPILALFVITTTNPVISVLCLVILSTLLSVVLFKINITFISLLYILVYVGAVAILFLFVIIILNVKEFEITELGKNYTKHLPLSFCFILIIILSLNNIPILTIELIDNFNQDINVIMSSIEITSLQSLAKALYGYNSLHFLITSFVLLTAIIGSILLCLINSTNNH